MAGLIVMACSSTKLGGAADMPAINRSDGPMWRTLRAALSEVPEDLHPSVWFLSARYGFHPAEMPIADYEERMTTARAAELLRLPTSNRACFADVAAGAGRVLRTHPLEGRDRDLRQFAHAGSAVPSACGRATEHRRMESASTSMAFGRGKLARQAMATVRKGTGGVSGRVSSTPGA